METDGWRVLVIEWSYFQGLARIQTAFTLSMSIQCFTCFGMVRGFKSCYQPIVFLGLDGLGLGCK